MPLTLIKKNSNRDYDAIMDFYNYLECETKGYICTIHLVRIHNFGTNDLIGKTAFQPIHKLNVIANHPHEYYFDKVNQGLTDKLVNEIDFEFY